METILAHAQELVSTLSSLMPTPYQKDNLEAMLALFLERKDILYLNIVKPSQPVR
jgi:hypothetical protein